MRRQLRALGLGHDPRRGSPPPTSRYYRWTQWIFLQIFNSWYDDDAGPGPPDRRARRRSSRPAPRAESDANPDDAAVATSSTRASSARSSTRTGSRTSTRRRSTGARRSAPCSRTRRSPPTAAASAATFPVYRRPLKQWMLRITAYADRLLADLDLLDWPDSIKLMQRNWIGRSVGADGARSRSRGTRASTSRCSRPGPTRCSAPPTWCSRPSTRCVDEIIAERVARRRLGDDFGDMLDAWKGMFGADEFAAGGGAAATASSRPRSRSSSGRPKAREKTGVFIGRVRDEPHQRRTIPIFVADYVLMGYGTGAIMAVPAHDQRDFEFAARVRPPDRRAWCVRPTAGSRERGVDADTPATNGPRRTSATASA